MTLLSQLLPAVRQIRAPLVGGYLWLLAGWLRWAKSVPDSTDSDPGRYWEAVRRIVDELGDLGSLAAVSVAAYLLGSLVSEAIGQTVRHFAELDIDEMEQVREVWEAKYAAETPIRLFAEAELRLNIAPPLVAITLVLPPSLLSFALLTAVATLAMHGLWLLNRARTKWETALRISRIDTGEHLEAEAQGHGETATRGSLVAKDDGPNHSPSAHAPETDTPPKLEDALDKLRELSPNAKVSAHALREGEFSMASGIQIVNTGPGAARRVSILDGDDAEVRFFKRGTFPIDELPAGTQIKIPFSYDTRPTTSELEFWLTWEDKHGSQRKLRKLDLAGHY